MRTKRKTANEGDAVMRNKVINVKNARGGERTVTLAIPASIAENSREEDAFICSWINDNMPEIHEWS